MRVVSLKQKPTILLFSQKSPDHIRSSVSGRIAKALVAAAILFSIVLPAKAQLIIRKTLVTFAASDGLIITADHYYSKKTNPYILLFHTEYSSRGEYDSIAGRYAKMNYNCLAVDLRSGDKFGFVENETAKRALREGFNTSLLRSVKDIEAAIQYAYNLSSQPVILLGSSASASLCLIAGLDNPEVKAIMAFSPGEYFKPGMEIEQLASHISKPLFVATSGSEAAYVKEMFLDTNKKFLNLFGPGILSHERGAGLLSRQNPESDQYWLAVLIFIKSL